MCWATSPQAAFRRYYCDFLADSSQLILLKKLQRWETVLIQRSAARRDDLPHRS